MTTYPAHTITCGTCSRSMLSFIPHNPMTRLSIRVEHLDDRYHAVQVIAEQSVVANFRQRVTA